MEKGSDGFDQRLYNSDNLPGIETMIRQIVEPIKEMHQVGMHLDVKPQNFLFVPSGGAEMAEGEEKREELLKLIDFDGAEQFPEKVGWLLWRRRLERRKRADYRKIPKIRLASPMYSSPESYRMLHGNLLHIVPQKRMTAEGVLDYLDLKCYPAEMSWSYAWTGLIFNKITFKKLAEMIIERKRLCTHENCTRKWEQMRKMMEKVRKKRQAIVNESQQMSDSVKHCATTHQNATE
ncbi:hypothetical protein GPALN_005828 [Globodera pallida]|nr:hypothetical protein GPALN_005828 [Globodera pallida]